MFLYYFSRHFMFIRINSEPIEKYFEFYEKIVPNIYTPEPGVMEVIIVILKCSSTEERARESEGI